MWTSSRLWSNVGYLMTVCCRPMTRWRHAEVLGVLKQCFRKKTLFQWHSQEHFVAAEDYIYDSIWNSNCKEMVLSCPNQRHSLLKNTCMVKVLYGVSDNQLKSCWIAQPICCHHVDNLGYNRPFLYLWIPIIVWRQNFSHLPPQGDYVIGPFLGWP